MTTAATTDTSPLLTVREAAARLNVSMQTARRLIWRGELPAIKVAGAYRIDADELDEYIYGRETT
jgi:excisionase family DNA binding protein